MDVVEWVIRLSLWTLAGIGVGALVERTRRRNDRRRSMISEAQIQNALNLYTTLHGEPPGKTWRTFGNDISARHSEQSARAIVTACLILDVPVSDVLTGETWAVLVNRLAAIEDRLDRHERAVREGRDPHRGM